VNTQFPIHDIPALLKFLSTQTSTDVTALNFLTRAITTVPWRPDLDFLNMFYEELRSGSGRW